MEPAILFYNQFKLKEAFKIVQWYKRKYFINITLPRLWLAYEELMKTKYHPNKLCEFMQFD